MIHTFEYKLPLGYTTSFQKCQECGTSISGWHLQSVNDQQGYIEWKVQSPLSFPSYVRLYLRQQRPEYTLITIYINRPFRLIDPFSRSRKIYAKLSARLDEAVRTTSATMERQPPPDTLTDSA